MPLLLLGQTTFYSPEKPQANDEVTIQYNTENKKAKFTITDEIYVIIASAYENGGYTTRYEKMQKESNLFKLKIKVSENDAYYHLYFITLMESSYDFNADVEFKIFSNTGQPVKNACSRAMGFTNYVQEMNEELKYYPENYSVYRTKWFMDKFSQPDKYKDILKSELEKISKTKNNSIELMYAKSYGYLLLGDLENSCNIILEMIKQYPDEAYTYLSLDSFMYEYQINNYNNPLINKIKNAAESIILNHADSEYSWNLIFSHSQLFPDECVLSVCNERILKNHEDPFPYIFAAEIMNRNNSNLEDAMNKIEKAIELTMNGFMRFNKDIGGKLSIVYKPRIYYIHGEIAFKLKKYYKALSAVKIGESVAIQSSEKADLFFLEGDILYSMKDYKLAEEAYFQAWKNGNNKAKEKIRECYNVLQKNNGGFEQYFNSKSRIVIKGNKKESLKEAKPFTVSTITGEKVSLNALKGKIVVLNFWFTGCGPCKQEIPYLNELVNKYDPSKVVFIAFAIDKSKRILKEFLKDTPFKYKIIPNSAKIASDYRIVLYPSHTIIDRTGKIVFHVDGGGDENIKERIPNMINKLLEEMKS